MFEIIVYLGLGAGVAWVSLKVGRMQGRRGRR
jgi:hypothetical protein